MSLTLRTHDVIIWPGRCEFDWVVTCPRKIAYIYFLFLLAACVFFDKLAALLSQKLGQTVHVVPPPGSPGVPPNMAFVRAHGKSNKRLSDLLYTCWRKEKKMREGKNVKFRRKSVICAHWARDFDWANFPLDGNWQVFAGGGGRGELWEICDFPLNLNSAEGWKFKSFVASFLCEFWKSVNVIFQMDKV